MAEKQNRWWASSQDPVEWGGAEVWAQKEGDGTPPPPARGRTTRLLPPEWGRWWPGWPRWTRPHVPTTSLRSLRPTAAAKEATCSFRFGSCAINPLLFSFLVFNAASGKNKTEGVSWRWISWSSQSLGWFPSSVLVNRRVRLACRPWRVCTCGDCLLPSQGPAEGSLPTKSNCAFKKVTGTATNQSEPSSAKIHRQPGMSRGLTPNSWNRGVDPESRQMNSRWTEWMW